MFRRAFIALIAAIALAVGTVTPAFASGSADFYPTAATCPSSTATPSSACRAAIEWRTSAYGPSGQTTIKRRTLFSVYAAAGEQILLGSSSIGTGTADIVVWNPGIVPDTEATTLPGVVTTGAAANGYSCAAQRTASGVANQGRIVTRAQELAGARSITGGGNASGYIPCYYTAPSAGIYRVAFYGSAGGASDDQVAPDGVIDPTSATTNSTGAFPTPTGSTAVLAWDVTVRAAATTSTTAIPGRVFTYVFAGYTGDNPRPVTMKFYLNTLDGFRYLVDANGMDPNAWVIYGNQTGFLNADGTPLNRDVMASSDAASPQTLSALAGGTKLAAPQYPLSFEPLAEETLAALSIPAAPENPTMTELAYQGRITASGSYLGGGGTFTFKTGTPGTYQIVISRDGVDFDPGLPTNAVLRGVVAAAGSYTVTWNGKDTEGTPFPTTTQVVDGVTKSVAAHYAVSATLRGGEYHAPMIDVEGSTRGGPSITLLNPPNGTCPFTGVTQNATKTNCTRAFFDDRGYYSSSKVLVGASGGLLCPNLTGAVPSPLFSNPVTGFDSTSTMRAFGDVTKMNANAFCPAASAKGTLGDAKGLDIWTFFPSATQSSLADVLPLPKVPVAAPDEKTIAVDTSASAAAASGVLANDLGTGITVTGNTAPARGTLTLAADGSYVYTPTAHYSGTDQVTYTITDNAGQATTSTLSIRINPAAATDALSTQAGSPITVGDVLGSGLLGNDVGTSIALSATTDPSHGTLSSIGTKGGFTYSPNAGYSGTDGFTYTITDGSGGTSTTTVNITVTPRGVDDTGSTAANTALQVAPGGVLANDLASGSQVTGVTTGPAHGSVTVETDGGYLYTPSTGFSGSDSFVYTAKDSSNATYSATARITVTPTGLDDTGSTTAGVQLVVGGSGVLGNDAGTGLTVTTNTQPAHGGVVLQAGGGYVYTPAAGFSGVDAFTYTATDSAGRGYTRTVSITVSPTGADDAASTSAGIPVTIAARGVLANDSGTALTVVANTAPAHGAVSVAADGGYTYTPAVGFSGADSFTYTASDTAGRTAVQTVRITVTPVGTDDVGTTPANTALVVPASGVLGNDHGAGLTVSAHTAPAHGSVTIATTGGYTYTPAQGYSGADTFTYTARDGIGSTTVQTVRITVTPVGADDSVRGAAGERIHASTGDTLGNDIGSDLVITGHTDAAHGQLELSADGTFVYSPDPGFSGVDTFTYTAKDADGSTITQTVTVMIDPAAVQDAAGLATTGVAVGGPVGVGLALLAAGVLLLRRRRVIG